MPLSFGPCPNLSFDTCDRIEVIADSFAKQLDLGLFHSLHYIIAFELCPNELKFRGLGGVCQTNLRKKRKLGLPGETPQFSTVLLSGTSRDEVFQADSVHDLARHSKLRRKAG